MMPVHVEEGSELWQAVEAAKNASAGKWIFNDDGMPDAGILAVAKMDSLWRAVLARCEDLVPRDDPRGSSRSTGMYHADGRGCSAVLQRCNHDGTRTVWHVEAHDVGSGRRSEITVHAHGPWLDNQDAEWEGRVVGERTVIAGHCWFTVGPGGSGGFGGHEFRFTALDGSGTEVVSRDMWFGGVIPPAWRERIPDTHEMTAGFYPGPVE